MTITDEMNKKRVLTIAAATNRLKWRFEQGKAFTPNFNDVQALNSILIWVARQKAAPLKEKPLFAKVYIILYQWLLKEFKTDPFDTVPAKKLHRLLDRDIDSIVKHFWDELNFDSLSERLDKLDPSPDQHPAFTTPEEHQEFLDNFRKLSEEEKREFWKKEYDFETVKDILTAEVNAALNSCGND